MSETLRPAAGFEPFVARPVAVVVEGDVPKLWSRRFLTPEHQSVPSRPSHVDESIYLSRRTVFEFAARAEALSTRGHRGSRRENSLTVARARLYHLDRFGALPIRSNNLS